MYRIAQRRVIITEFFLPRIIFLLRIIVMSMADCFGIVLFGQYLAVSERASGCYYKLICKMLNFMSVVLVISNFVNDGTLDGFAQEYQEHETACYPSVSNRTMKISK